MGEVHLFSNNTSVHFSWIQRKTAQEKLSTRIFCCSRPAEAHQEGISTRERPVHGPDVKKHILFDHISKQKKRKTNLRDAVHASGSAVAHRQEKTTSYREREKTIEIESNNEAKHNQYPEKNRRKKGKEDLRRKREQEKCIPKTEVLEKGRDKFALRINTTSRSLSTRRQKKQKTLSTTASKFAKFVHT